MISSGGDATFPLLALLVVLGLTAALFLAPSNTRVSLEGDVLRVRLNLRDWFFCVCRGQQIPVADIAGVTLAPTRSVPRVGFRVGAALPSLRSGTFLGRGFRDFWNVRTADTVLVIVMNPGARFRRVILEVSDPQQVIGELRPTLGAWAGLFS